MWFIKETLILIYYMIQSVFLIIYGALTGQSEDELIGRKVVNEVRITDRIDYTNYPEPDYHAKDEAQSILYQSSSYKKDED